MGQTIKLPAINKLHCPIKALARRVHHVLKHGGTLDSLLCLFADKGTLNAVTPESMIGIIRTAVKVLGLHKNGIDPNLIGVHSLRTGVAMAIKLSGNSDTTIMKHGRWSSLTFLMYIHNQIGHLSKDLTTAMDTPIPFLNIACV